MSITKRQAVAIAASAADAIIEQLTRRANGWDKGSYRDDELHMSHTFTIAESLRLNSNDAFDASRMFAV